MSRKLRTATLLLTGMVLGCGVAAVAPEVASFSTPASAGGGWQCYRAHDFPDVDDARTDKEAQNTAQGLDQIASDAAIGTILTIQVETSMSGKVYSDAVCVKR